jgi:hypothetical protein
MIRTERVARSHGAAARGALVRLEGGLANPSIEIYRFEAGRPHIRYFRRSDTDRADARRPPPRSALIDAQSVGVQAVAR